VTDQDALGLEDDGGDAEGGDVTGGFPVEIDGHWHDGGRSDRLRPPTLFIYEMVLLVEASSQDM
jgi:hypothetical protein